MPGPELGAATPGPDVGPASRDPILGVDGRGSHGPVANQFLSSSAMPWGRAGPKMGHLGPRASGGGGVVWGSPVRVLARGSCPSQSPASRRLSQGPAVCLSTSHLVTLQCAGGLWPFPRTPCPNLCVAAGKYFLQKQDGCEKNNNAPKPHLMGRSWARGLVRPE